MGEGSVFILTLIAALGSGLIGGVFFAFSTFVMQALSRLRPDQGIAAMQSINVAVLNRWFLTPFLGTAAACLVLAISSLFAARDLATLLRLAGSSLYLAGTVLVTVVCNVPRNDALATVVAGSEEGKTLWAHYLPGWTVWNTVRAVAAVMAATALTVALVASRGGPPE
jgi:uncharacterized membrane protein